MGSRETKESIETQIRGAQGNIIGAAKRKKRYLKESAEFQAAIAERLCSHRCTQNGARCMNPAMPGRATCDEH